MQEINENGEVRLKKQNRHKRHRENLKKAKEAEQNRTTETPNNGNFNAKNRAKNKKFSKNKNGENFSSKSQNLDDLIATMFADDISENSQEITQNQIKKSGENSKKNSRKFSQKQKKSEKNSEISAENKEISKPQNNANTETKNENKKQKRKKNKTLPKSLTGDEPWQEAMQKTMELNKAGHDLRLHPLKYLNRSDEKIRITPLGGLGEIGSNMTIFETENSAIIVDIGMSFPNENMLGVDIVIPDFDYVRKIKDKIAGIIITHAHEDHIGAVPYFFKEFAYPIYAVPLTLGMISNKFEEHDLKAQRELFRPVEKRKIYQIGDFEIEFIHITHSIIDSSALAITTKAGTIIHTGDFKIDHTPIDGYPTDLHRLAYYGERGVMLLMSDSTNSHKEGVTKSESSVGKTFDAIFSQSKGRVIMSTFSSNLHRVYQAIERGIKFGRKVCVIGRSMERNLFTAMELGYINIDRKIFIDADEVSKYPENQVLIITTGSQGETMSALYRMATDEHKYIKIKPDDQIIISAKAIPGNEASVSVVLNYLLKSGAKVAYQDFSEIHVSGHASIDEQKLMLRLVKPKFFLPVHGEYNHIVKHKETAISCGVDEKNIYLMTDGDQMEVCEKYLKRVRTIKVGKVFIDNQINKQISDDIVKHRQNLADAGVVMIIAWIDKHAKSLTQTRVVSYGLVNEAQNKAFAKEMEDVLVQFLANTNDQILLDQWSLETKIRQAVRKHIFRKVKKYPTIVPVIYLM